MLQKHQGGQAPPLPVLTIIGVFVLAAVRTECFELGQPRGARATSAKGASGDEPILEAARPLPKSTLALYLLSVSMV